MHGRVWYGRVWYGRVKYGVVRYGGDATNKEGTSEGPELALHPQ